MTVDGNLLHLQTIYVSELVKAFIDQAMQWNEGLSSFTKK